MAAVTVGNVSVVDVTNPSNPVTVATVPLDSNGNASFVDTSYPVGNYTWQANYNPAPPYVAGQSSTFPVQITAANQTVTVTASASPVPVVEGMPLTISITVTSP